MSSLIVPVTEILSVRKHPGADALDIVEITGGGYQLVAALGSRAVGEITVYVPPDTLVPEAIADRMNIRNYLAWGSSHPGYGRTKMVRLRGEPSAGFLMPAEPGDEPGDNVTERYGFRKYEPPIRVSAGDAERDHPAFPRYVDIENLRLLSAEFSEGERVAATEKIHGTSTRVGWTREPGTDAPVWMAGSRTLRRKMPTMATGEGEEPRLDEQAARTNPYWYPLTVAPVRALLESLAAEGVGVRSAILYGETYGPKIQSMGYGVSPNALAFAAFDLMVDGKFVDARSFHDQCARYGVPVAPILYEGSFDLATLKELANGPTVIGQGAHIREGIVVKPMAERYSQTLGRVVLKLIGDEYGTSKHKERDSTDV